VWEACYHSGGRKSITVNKIFRSGLSLDAITLLYLRFESAKIQGMMKQIYLENRKILHQ